MRAMEYIEKNCNYDANLIKEYVYEYRTKGFMGPYYEFDKLELFVKRHNRLYIYGNGNWGKITADYLTSRGLSFDGVIVTAAKLHLLTSS